MVHDFAVLALVGLPQHEGAGRPRLEAVGSDRNQHRCYLLTGVRGNTIKVGSHNMKEVFKYFGIAMVAIALFSVCVVEVGGIVVGLAKLASIAVPMVVGWYC